MRSFCQHKAYTEVVLPGCCRYNNLDEAYRSKSEEGLSRFLAFLREEEERERLEEIERLKPIGIQVTCCLDRQNAVAHTKCLKTTECKH